MLEEYSDTEKQTPAIGVLSSSPYFQEGGTARVLLVWYSMCKEHVMLQRLTQILIMILVLIIVVFTLLSYVIGGKLQGGL